MAQKRYQIRWAANAFKDYEIIYEALLSNWSSEIAAKFSQRLEAHLFNLSFHPFIGRKSENKHNVRSILISRFNRLYYSLDKDTIELIGIFDMRQNPAKNKFR